MRRLLPLWLLFLLAPVAFSGTASENFRLPKLLLSDCLALASLAWLSLRLRDVERVDFAALRRQPVVLAVLPVLAVATSGLLSSDHTPHVREGLASLWIAGACLVGWSLALSAREHRKLLWGLMIPAGVLAVLALLQFHGLFNPFRFEGEVSERIGLTSLAGGAFDLAAYLALPCLIAQVGWREAATPGRRWGWGLAAAACFYALAASQTLTALAGVAAGTIVLWMMLLSRRRFAAIAVSIVLAAVAVGVGLGPLRERLENKLGSLRRGEINRVLSGRMDGWQAALWMVREHPLTGVGHGAYRAEYGSAKGALASSGVAFSRSPELAYFVNAHNDLLEAVAEWGLPGALALVWGLAVLVRVLRRSAPVVARSDVALMWAGLTALSVLALMNFPLRIALVAYPAVLFLSWIFAARREAAA